MQAKKTLNYKIEPEKYLFGICELFEGAIDKQIAPEETLNLIRNMGFGSMRVWMHHKDLLVSDGNDEISLNQDAVSRYHSYVNGLTERGISHIVSMNHSYLYPADFDGKRTAESEIPLPGSACYLKFLQMIERSYELVSREFPEIPYFEVGNEVNMHRFICKPNYPYGKLTEKDYDERYCYTPVEKAQITADICYYARRGVKKGNPSAFVVLPAPTPYFGYTDCAAFLDKIYTAVESGKYPTGLPADTDADHYFEVLSWHPYNFGGDSKIFVDGCNEMYAVAQKHGDDGKKVFITEFGYHDFDFVDSGRCKNKQEADALQASFFKTDFAAFREQLPYVETVHIFRLYDWVAGPGIEIDFGLFTSPAETGEIRPKEKGKALFYLINGQDADIRKIMLYAKGN